MDVAIGTRADVLGEHVDRLGSRATPLLLAAVRIMTGLVWLQNAGWKTPPDFGKATKSGLYRYTHTAIDAPVLDPFTWIVRHAILPNWTAFGWMTLIAEAGIGALLVLGLWTRTAALLGLLATIPIALSVLHLKGEWPWSYYLMLLVHAALIVSAAGRHFALDSIRRRANTDAWRTGARALGIITIAIGALGFLRAPSTSFMAPNGKPIGPASGYELSLMTFNRAGALLVIAIGAIALVAATTKHRTALLGAAFAAAAYSVQILLQFRPKTHGIFGGDGSTLSFVLALAIGFAVLGTDRPRRRATPTR